MGDDELFEHRAVKVPRGREVATLVAWQQKGWEFVTEAADGGRRHPTTMTFRRQQVRTRRRAPLFTLGACVLVILIAGIGLNWQPISDRIGLSHRDSDHDGIPDRIESAGWKVQDGGIYRTDPDRRDSDGDGLTDGDEAGQLGTTSGARDVYRGLSNPLVADSDDDDLGDGDEVDLGLDPMNRDYDGDGLTDGREVAEVGSAPDVTDTDGDGYDDAYEVQHRTTRGLNPLWVDHKVSKLSYVADYSKGLLAGDLWRGESLAWLAGNLTAGASSSIPVIGSVVGAVTDIRDAIGSAIHADWVGSSFSAVGAVPGGDAVAIPGKAAKFVARNPELAAAVAAMVAALKAPEKIRVAATKKVFPEWDELRDAGASDKQLLQLAKGRTDLSKIAAAMRRPGHVPGRAAGNFSDWRDGERWLATTLGATGSSSEQVRHLTTGCGQVCLKPLRISDVVVNGVAHESKVGYAVASESTLNQIREDAWLIRSGQIDGAHWHFFASSQSITIGADPKMLDLLDEMRIPYTIHLPTSN